MRHLRVHIVMSVVEFLIMLGGVIAAGAISIVCGLGLVVWMAGGTPRNRDDDPAGRA
jgi:hypothetical protein